MVAGRTAVVSCASTSPLRLLVPRPRGAAAWVLAASHGGGLVAGDDVALDVDLGAGTAVCLGTQAETKVYRSAGPTARQSLRARVGPGALLAVLPEPVSPYAGARLAQAQSFELEPGGSLVLLDAVTCGRAARGERWGFDRAVLHNHVRVGERTLLADGLRLVAGEGPPLPQRLAGFELVATLALVGPAVAGAARALHAAIAAEPARGDGAVLVASSPLGDGALVRLVARSVAAGMERLRRDLAFLAAPLDGDPFTRRP